MPLERYFASPIGAVSEPGDEPEIDPDPFNGVPGNRFLADTGCDLWTDCLACPLPACREDVGRLEAVIQARAVGVVVLSRRRPPDRWGEGRRGDFSPEERAQMVSMSARGMTLRQIAEVFGTDAGTISKNKRKAACA